MTMTATNINLDQLIDILNRIRQTGTKIINLDMLPDELQPEMNKLVIHPVEEMTQKENQKFRENRTRNPNVNTNNDDIFNSFNNLI